MRLGTGGEGAAVSAAGSCGTVGREGAAMCAVMAGLSGTGSAFWLWKNLDCFRVPCCFLGSRGDVVCLGEVALGGISFADSCLGGICFNSRLGGI